MNRHVTGDGKRVISSTSQSAIIESDISVMLGIAAVRKNK